MHHYLPLYGKIRNISSSGSHMLTALCFDIDSNTHMAYFIDLNAVFSGTTQKNREGGILSHTLSTPGIVALSSQAHNYVVTKNEILRQDGSALTSIMKMSENMSLSTVCSNGDLALIFENNILQILSPKGEIKQESTLRATATAIAVSEDGQTLAIGFSDGFVEVFKRTNDALFSSVQKSKASKGMNPLKMHKDSVSALTILRYEDNREWMFSFGEDRKAMQAHTEELIASEKASMGLHNGIVSDIISPMAVDRFYSVSQDGEAKSWRRTPSKYPPSTVRTIADATSAALVRFTRKKSQDKQTNREDKFLAIAGGSTEDGEIQFWSFQETTEDSAGGQLTTVQHTISTGKKWVEHFISSEDKNVRTHIIDTISEWNVRFLDSLVNVTTQKKEDEDLRIYAVEKIAQTSLPEAPYKLKHVISQTSNRNTRVSALKHYVRLDTSLTPLEHGLNNNCKEMFMETLSILGERAKENTEARNLLEEAVRRSSWKEASEEVAKHALNTLYDIDKSIESLLEGVENPLLKTYCLEEIYRRNHVQEVEAEAQLMLSLRDSDADIRQKAQDILILGKKHLAVFARALDDSLHRRLCSIEAEEKDIPLPEKPPLSTVSKEAHHLLNEMMATPNEDISSYAALLATRLGAKDTLASQLIFMSSSQMNVRYNAVQGLIALESPRSNAGLIKAFCTDGNSTIREIAFTGVRIPRLDRDTSALASKYEDIRFRALESIGHSLKESKEVAVIELLRRCLLNEKYVDIANGAYKHYNTHKIEGSKTSTLKYLVQCANKNIRNQARENITSMLINGAPDALDLSIIALNVEDPKEASNWFVESCKALSKDQEKRTKLILHGIKHSYSVIRIEAFSYLYRNPQMDIGSELIAAINNNPEQSVRKEAYQASLSRWKNLRDRSGIETKDTASSDAFAQEFFNSAISSQYEDVKALVLGAFQAGPSQWRLSVLEQALKDNDSNLRSRAAAMLLQMGGVGFDILLGSTHLDIRFRAARALSQKGDMRAIAPLKKVLAISPPSKKEERYQVDSIFAREKFNHDMKSWHTEMIWALSSAQELRSNELLPELHKILENEHETYTTEIRISAIGALGTVASPSSAEALSLLQKMLGSLTAQISDAAAIALARMGNVEGLDAVWNTADESMQFELLLALQDQAYVLRAIAQGASYTSILILAFVLQAQFRGGNLDFLADALTASDKKSVLLSARLLQMADEKELLLAQLQRELNEWSAIKLNLISEASLNDNYYAFAEYINSYFSFTHLQDVSNRRRKIELSSWSLLAQLLASEDPRVRVSAASLLYRYKIEGINDSRFLSELSVLSERFITKTPMESKDITIDSEEAIQMAFGAYRSLASNQKGSKALRKEALYSYVQGLYEPRINNMGISSLLEQLLLDKDLAASSYGYILNNKENLSFGTDIVELGLNARTLETRRMALSLLVKEGDMERITTLAIEEKSQIALDAYKQLTQMYDARRLNGILKDVFRNRNNNIEPEHWKFWQIVFKSDGEFISFAKSHSRRANGDIEFTHRNQEVREKFEDLQPQYKAELRTTYANCINAKNTEVQQNIINSIISFYRTEEREEQPNKLLLSEYNTILGQALNSPDKKLRSTVVIALGNNGSLSVLKQLLTLVQTTTNTNQQNDIYKAIVLLCSAHRSESGMLLPELNEVAPTLVHRWFHDPSKTTVKGAIPTALRKIEDRSIVDSLFERLESHGYDREIYNLIKDLTGYKNNPPENWNGLAEKNKEKYLLNNYNDSSIAKLMAFDLKQSEWYRLNALLSTARISINSDGEMLSFALEHLLMLPNRKETNSVVQKVIEMLHHRYQHRSTIDSKEMHEQIQSRLLPLLESKDRMRAFLSAELLATMSNNAGYNLLLFKASDQAEKILDIRIRAFEALGYIANIGSIKLLLQYAGYNEYFEARPEEDLVNIDTKLRKAALQALGSMHQSSEADEILSLLRRNLGSTEYSLRAGAANGIGLFKEKGLALIKQEYENQLKHTSVRRIFIKHLAEDKNNTEYLMRLLRTEISINGLVQDVYSIIKERDMSNTEADILRFTNRNYNQEVIDALCIHANNKDLLHYAEMDYHHNARWYSDLIDALIDKKTQKDIGRQENYPIKKILDCITRSINTEKLDFIEKNFFPLKETATFPIPKAIDAAKKYWVKLNKQFLKGEDIQYEKSRIEDIWIQLLRYGSEFSQQQVAEMLTLPNLSDRLLSWSLQNIVPNAALVPEISKLLASNDRDLRTSAAALLQSFSLSDVNVVHNDPAAQYLLRKNSSSALLDSARNGSMTAVGNLARAGSLPILKELILDISAQEAVRVATANSLARLGTQEANTILEEANNTEKTSEFLLQKFAVAIKRGAHALEKNQRFAAKIKN